MYGPLPVKSRALHLALCAALLLALGAAILFVSSSRTAQAPGVVQNPLGAAPLPAAVPSGDFARPRAPAAPVSGASLNAPLPDASVFSEFSRWSEEYLEAPAAQRAVMEEQGVALAKARRPVMARLIKANPREALVEAVPMVVRQSLPPQVEAQLEKRVSGRGFFGVLGVLAGSEA